MTEAEVIAACVHDLNATKGTTEPGSIEWYELTIAAISLMTQVAGDCNTSRELIANILITEYDYSPEQAHYGDSFR